MEKYSKMIAGSYLYIPRKEMKDVGEARKTLTLKSKYAEKAEVELFDDSQDDWFGVPLHWFKNPEGMADEVIDDRVDGWPVTFQFRSKYWPGQEQVIRKFRALVDGGRTGVLFEAPPGFGKTVIMIKMIQSLERTALVVVP